MTIEEKREALSEFCDKQDACEICALYDVALTGCYTTVSDEVIEKHYAVVFDADKKLYSEPAPDNVNHPKHYETGKFECIDVMVETQGEEAVKAYCLCAAFKYLYRHNRKNGLEDIKKARWYLDKYVELEEGEADDKA